MKMKKKYLAAGSALSFPALHLCIEPTPGRRKQRYNRVSYVDGSKTLKKQRIRYPDQVSKKKTFRLNKLLKITDQVM